MTRKHRAAIGMGLAGGLGTIVALVYFLVSTGSTGCACHEMGCGVSVLWFENEFGQSVEMGDYTVIAEMGSHRVETTMGGGWAHLPGLSFEAWRNGLELHVDDYEQVRTITFTFRTANHEVRLDYVPDFETYQPNGKWCGPTCGEFTGVLVVPSELVFESNQPPPPPVRTYRYVRIDDYSPGDTGLDGGADIDAVIVTRADGSVSYADQVEAAFTTSGETLDPSTIIDMPDAFYEYPSLTHCRADQGAMSLGGDGGFVIVRIADGIGAGDKVSVLEVGECVDEAQPSRTLVAETIRVSISTYPEPTGTSLVLGEGVGPELELVVPPL